MSTPQMGIFSLGDASHSFLEFNLRGSPAAKDVVAAVADMHNQRKTIEAVNLVVGLRPELWRTAAPTDAPADATSFDRALVGPDGYTMPATQADVFVWIAGPSYDRVFDVASACVTHLATVAAPVRELTGWTYRVNRDLTGFEDGTENPTLEDAPGVALIPDGKPGAGGSILLFQQWRHDVAGWGAEPVTVQEQVIGRTKPDSIEFPEDLMPADSHVTRTTLDENGIERKIFRRNTPYGNLGDHGTLFIGFANERDPLQRMLERMAGIGDGVRDALTRYVTALTGAYYFIPALSTLAPFAPSAD